MKTWIGGWGGVLGFLAIAALVAGGLGWATLAALRLENAQLEQQAAAEHAEKARLALWRLDSRMVALLAAEDARPFSHYSALFVPPTALSNVAQRWPAGSVLEPSPLLSAPLEPWMLLHFQTDLSGWESPQVLSPQLDHNLRRPVLKLDLSNATKERKHLLDALASDLPAASLLTAARFHTKPATIQNRVLLAKLEQDNIGTANTLNYYETQAWRDFGARRGVQSRLVNPVKENFAVVKRELAMGCAANGAEWLLQLRDQREQPPAVTPAPPGYTNPPPIPAPPPAQQNPGGGTLPGPGPYAPAPTPGLSGGVGRLGRAEPPTITGKRFPPSAEVQVHMSPHAGAWVGGRLLYFRLVKLEEREVCQGVLLDAKRLSCVFCEEVQDLLPDASLHPIREPSAEMLQLSMASLPFRLDPGPVPPAEAPGWTGLRVGLLLAWIAALVALTAVGLGGWGLWQLSASRGRFVSSVTHELRTPLTTLRLYLDMLLGGMVKDEAQRLEYMRTLHAETDRLNRLVSNVLDYSRLEGNEPRLSPAPLDVAALLTDVQNAWRVRCETSNKELVVENAAPAGAIAQSDLCLLAQVLGNLLDNSCKYTHDAQDRRLWLRARVEAKRLLFEVEDRGPGIPAAEQRAVFRAFRRGGAASDATGGVGLGLALARRWARLLGGRLSLRAPAEGGVCFRLELPLA